MNGVFRARLVVAGLVLALLGVAVAVAAWTSSGSGPGAAQAGTAAGVTLAAGTPSASLVPTASADVATVISNSNSYKVHVSSIALDSSQGTNGFAVDAGHSGCNLAALSYSTQTNGGAGWDVTAGGNSSLDLSGAISMSNAAVDACQGATFTVYLTATAVSAP
jgi:hypothetical protein